MTQIENIDDIHCNPIMIYFVYIDRKHLSESECDFMNNRKIFVLGASLLAVIAIALIVVIAVVKGEKRSVDNADEGKQEGNVVRDDTSEPQVVVRAQYPVMAQYPMDDESYDKYDEWIRDVSSRRGNPGYADSLETFWNESINVYLSGAGDENRAYSPVNVYMALGMLAEITDGNSRQQILDVLGQTDIAAHRKLVNDVWNAHYRDDGATTQILASSLWLSDAIAYKKDTLDLLASNYYASSFSGVMGSDAYNKMLQDWLDEQTGGLLKNQAQNVKMKEDTIIALATTIYYKAKWMDEFRKGSTNKEIFHGAKGDNEVDFMHSKRVDNYYWADNFTAYGKSMENSSGDMFFILPDEGVSVDEVLKDSDFTSFIRKPFEWENNKRVLVNASIPKFDIESGIDLIGGLKQMGITDVFSDATSDFSPVLEQYIPSFISQAQHSVRVKIDEEGVEAAAFTVMINAATAMPPNDEVDFVLDRPFIFVINSSDGLPLFVGVINNVE